MIITFMNMKGGVGKTTMCIHVAGVFASKPSRVLVIDYDAQFNASQHLLEPQRYYKLEDENKTIFSVLSPPKAKISPFVLAIPSPDDPLPPLNHFATRVITYRNGGYLDLVPGSLNLMYLALGQSRESLDPMEKRFEKFAASCSSAYDHVLSIGAIKALI